MPCIVPEAVRHGQAVSHRSCAYRCGDATYDLSELLRWGGGSITASDRQGAVYHWAVCSHELPPVLQCGNHTVTAAGEEAAGSEEAQAGQEAAAGEVGGMAGLVAATRVAHGQCKTIGAWEDKAGLPMPCFLRDAARPSEGVQCHLYTGGTGGGASLLVDFVCMRDAQGGSAPPRVQSLSALSYLATVHSDAACALAPASPLPLIITASAGAAALLLVLLGLAVYYRRRASAAEGGRGGGGERARGRRGAKEGAGASGAGGSGGSGGPLTADELRAQLLADSDDDDDHAGAERGNSRRGAPGEDGSGAGGSAGRGGGASPAYRPFTSPVADADDARAAGGNAGGEDEARGRACAASVSGLEALLRAAQLEDRVAAAGAWCVANGWVSVAHLRGGGPRATDAFVTALRLKADGPRARRLKRELKRDVWGWDAHAHAAAACDAGRAGGRSR